jgi:small subunit ribosomal protein S1
MSDAPTPDPQPVAEAGESFDQILSQFEQSHSRRSDPSGRQLEGTVIVVSRESVLLDIGFKSEGILPLAEFESAGEPVKPGDRMMVSVKGRDPEGYYELSRSKIERPRDWSALERAFAEKATVAGTVIGVVKGGLSVDVGVRAFLPASRSGARTSEEM